MPNSQGTIWTKEKYNTSLQETQPSLCLIGSRFENNIFMPILSFTASIALPISKSQTWKYFKYQSQFFKITMKMQEFSSRLFVTYQEKSWDQHNYLFYHQREPVHDWTQHPFPTRNYIHLACHLGQAVCAPEKRKKQ